MPGPGVIPTVGSTQGQGVYFVNGDFGNDGYSGTSPQQCIKSLDVAYNKCAGGNNEIVYLIGGSAAVSYSSAIASGGAGLLWSKNYTHLIGLNAGGMIGERSRITAGATSATLLTPMIEFRGKGCLVQNVEFANGGSHATSAAVSVLVTGARNAFVNCQISGGLDATTAGNAACRSLVVSDAQGGGAADENYFNHCYIGLDTQSRTSTSSEVEFIGAGSTGIGRLVFENCVFSSYGTGGHFFLLYTGTNAIDRFSLFRGCQFINSSLSGGTAMTYAFSIASTIGGLILLSNCLLFGATNTSATKTDTYFDNAYATGTTAKAVIAGW